MPKGKFQGFYYGLGMQLDEASVEKAGQQLEGRLNKVVDNVTKQVVSISDAVAKGTKNIDTKNLVASLVEAQKELNQFQDFDPSKLQHQIDGLNETVNKLTDNLGEVKEKLMSFTNDISNRLSNIEILTPKMGTDALKKDILEMKNIVSSLSEISKTSEIDIPTDLLEASIKKIKDGMASIKASGNSLELFSDKDIAKEFVAITNLLRNIGDPVASLKKEFVDLALVFNDSFADDNVAKIFKNNLGYQIESETLKLERAKNEIKQYKDMVDSLNSTTHDWQNKLSSSDSELLNTFKSSTTVENLDVIIKKIEEYEKTLHELDDVKNVDYRNTMENMLALIQSTEKTMSSMDKKNLDSLLSVWKNAFNGNDLQSGNKLSVLWLEDYRDNIKIVVEEIEAESKNLEQIIRKTQDRLYMLEGREKEQISKTQKNTTQKSKRNVVQGVVAEVEAKIKINKSEWAKSINDAILSLTAINEKGNSKIKPVVIKVQTNKKDLVDQITAIRDQVNSALGGDKRTNKSTVNEAGETVTPDVTKFNKRFKEFMRNLEKRKQEITAYLKDEWHPALKEAFSFKMELLGIDNKSMTEKIDTHILSTVDAINIALAEKPLEFHSNIDALIEEIQNKVENIKLNGNISLGVGNVAINPQNLSNVNLIAGNITQNRGQTPTTSIIPPANKTSVQKQTKSPLGTIDKQKIYNDAVNRLNSASLTLDMVKDDANKLYKQLINAEEGTEKYYQAQILLTTLLSKWRGKIGAKSKNKQPEVPGLLGVRGANANWEKYLIDNGILLDPKNSRIIPSVSKLEEMYGLTKPKISSASKRTKITTKKSEMTPEEVLANRFNNGKEVIEYFISLAKMGKNLNLIREIADKPITADMFNDDSLTKWIRGKVYTKEDVGSYAPGKKITTEALDEFLSTMGITEADLAEANTKEETEFLTPLKKYIYTFMQNRQKLNTLLTTLTESQSGKTVVDGYNAIGSDKTEYLAGNLSSVIKNLTPKTPTTKAQQYVSDIFNKYNIDLSKLPSAKTYAEQWQIIQQQLIGKEGLDFNSLMSDLGQLKGNVGKTYENFMALLKVARAYMETSNSLGEVGREADLLIKGRTEKVKTKRRRWNNQTGQYDDVESEVSRTVQQGIRGLLKQLKVVFENEIGQTVLGYNLGKGYIPDDIFLSPKGSFTKIIDKLTNALNDSSKILFDQKNFMMDGSRDVDRWVTPNSTNNSIYQPNTVALTEKGQIQEWILNTQNLISVLENNNSRTEEQSNRLSKLKEHLPSLETRLKTADNKKVTYNKSYDQATSDLPLAQKGYINARENLATLVNQYTSERMSAITDALSKKQLGTLSDKEVKSIQDTLYNIVNLNEQLQKGTITQEEYIKKVTEAYILMRNATTDEAKITAKTDAEKLAQATLLVKRYQEEEALLKKIIRTQKPKATTSLVENKTHPESTLSSGTANAGNVPIDNSGATQVAIPQGTVSIPSGNIVLGGTIGDIATAENQNTIINLLKNGVKVIGKISDDGASNSGKSKTPKIPDTTKVNTQFDNIRKINGINKDSSLYKRYMSAKSNLDSALSDASTKGKNFAKEDANKIKALSNEVTKLGRQIINASNSLDQFKERGGQAFTSTANEVRTLKDEMLELAYKNASASHMLLSNVSYDEVTQKMSYNLTDLEGNVTKVTMAYDDLFGNILTMSDKTTNSVSQIYKTIEGEMTKRIGINNLTKDTPNLEKSKEYKDYLSRYDAMINAQDILREKGELATKTEKDGLISITNKVEEARIKFEKLANASEQFKSKIKDQNDLDLLPNGFNMEDETLLEQQMKNFALNQEGLTEKQKKMINETWNFKNAQDGATYSVLKGKDQIASMAIEMDKGSQSLGRYTIETKKYTSGFDKFMTSLQGKWQEVIRYLATFGSLYRVWGELQRGVQYIKEIDSALTELKKVTDETEKTYDRFLNTAAKTADKVGSTIKEVVSSTADWARLGYSLEEAANLAESTSVLLNVSEFQSIDDATSALVSTMQAFGYAAKDSMHVVDVMNEIGNNYAVSSDGVATALQDSASSLMAANNSYQEAVSLIAAANRVVILRHGL